MQWTKWNKKYMLVLNNGIRIVSNYPSLVGVVTLATVVEVMK